MGVPISSISHSSKGQALKVFKVVSVKCLPHNLKTNVIFKKKKKLGAYLIKSNLKVTEFMRVKAV